MTVSKEHITHPRVTSVPCSSFSQYSWAWLSSWEQTADSGDTTKEQNITTTCINNTHHSINITFFFTHIQNIVLIMLIWSWKMMIINFCNYFVSDINLKVPKQKNQTNNKKQKQQNIYIYIFFTMVHLYHNHHICFNYLTCHRAIKKPNLWCFIQIRQEHSTT